MKKEIKIGIIAVVGIVILVFGINYLKNVDLFHKQTHYIAVYARIDGLAAGNPVQLNGFKIGSISKIYFHPNNTGQIVVDFTIKNLELKVPKNSIASIISSDLLGSKSLEIRLGDSRRFLKPGDTLYGETKASLSDEVKREVMPLKNKAQQMLGSVDSILTVLKFVLDKNAVNNIDQSLTNISKVISNLQILTSNINVVVDKNTSEFNHIVTNADSITTSLRKNSRNINSLISNLAYLSDSLKKANITQTLIEANKAIIDFNIILQKIKKGDGTVGKLLNNDSLYIRMDKTAKDLDLLIIDVRENPKRYAHFSVFGKKNIPYADSKDAKK